jgi:3-hydroxy-9,10-secoandrosta-1,3,5(10)-triene-9,17-dione monooxygenase
MDQRTPSTGHSVLPVPEPDLTPRDMIARATALRPMIRADQDAAEARGTYSPELHRAFLDAGFYRAMQPRMFGGYEFPVAVFYKTMLEISRGDPGIGWCLTLCASHPFLVASHWPEAAQRDFFGDDGFFAAPHRPPPVGTATPVAGGYIVDGVWDYCSGIPYSSHLVAGVRILDGEDPPVLGQVVVPKAKVTVLDDWGGDRTLGMRASGSNSVKVDQVFVPAHHLVRARQLWATPDDIVAGGGTEGTRLHRNPAYLGRLMGPYHMSLVTPVIGAARAAIDEYEEIIKTRKTLFPPITPRVEHVDFQRAYGQATTLADAAEAILIRGGQMYAEMCQRWADDGTLITVEDNLRLWGMMQHAGQLACQATEIIFNASSSVAAKKGHRIQRYYRDCAMYRSHISSQHLNFAAPIARAHFGLKVELFGL